MSNLNDLTAQEVYNIVRDHLLTQNKKSKKDIDGRQVCAYKGENGLSCAVGCLIPDDVYTRNMEGKSVVCMDIYCPSMNLDLAGFFRKHSQLLGELQSLHDSQLFSVEDWPERLAVIAERHNLTP